MHADTVERLKPETFNRSAPAGGRVEKDALLPSPGDPYKAAGVQENGEVSRLVLVMGKEGFKSEATAYYFLQYVHIGMGEFGFDAGGQFFRFVFSDIQPKLVTIRGRNLMRVCDYIALRRMPWIRVADRDFRPVDDVVSDEPIITRIDVADWVRLGD